jgi:DNA primase
MNKIFDRFRGRLIFPVWDSLGRVVGFGGRALAKDQEPKYLNSPETLVYQKSQLLYAFFQAKDFIKKSQTVVVVEGYMDALACVAERFEECGGGEWDGFDEAAVDVVKTLREGFDFEF